MGTTLVLGDMHVGSLVAVWPERGLLPEGGEWRLNKPQRHLLRRWKTLEERVSSLPKLDAIIVNGDVIDGARPYNIGIVTPRLDYQASAAIDLLAPLREHCDKFYMIRGTGGHGGLADQDVTQIARALDATVNKETGECTWPELLYDVGGDNIWQFAHHIGVSKRLAYRGTALLSAFTDYKLELELAYGKRAPNLTGMCRSHAHRMLHVDADPWHMLAIPGWKLKDEYAYKVAPSSLPEIGYGLIEYDGSVRVRPMKFDIPVLHVEKA